MRHLKNYYYFFIKCKHSKDVTKDELIFISDLKYTRQQGMECFPDNNIHVINSNVTPNYDACSNWCGGNSDCGGYIVRNKKCYFTRKSCNNNLPINTFTTAFIPEGNYFKYNNIFGSRNTKCRQKIS